MKTDSSLIMERCRFFVCFMKVTSVPGRKQEQIPSFHFARKRNKLISEEKLLSVNYSQDSQSVYSHWGFGHDMSIIGCNSSFDSLSKSETWKTFSSLPKAIFINSSLYILLPTPTAMTLTPLSCVEENSSIFGPFRDDQNNWGTAKPSHGSRLHLSPIVLNTIWCLLARSDQFRETDILGNPWN